MSNLLLIVIYILVGYLLRFVPLLPRESARRLNSFVIFVSLPAMILLLIPKLDFGADAMIPALTAWIVMGMSAGAVWLLSRQLGFSREVTGALMLVTVLGNSSFVGIPLISAYYGEAALPYVIVYDQLGTFIAFSTYGTLIGSYYSHRSEINLLMILKKLILFPPFTALIVAMMIRDISFTPLASDILGYLAATTIPLALVAVGLQLQLRLPREELKPLVLSLSIKLLAAPAVAIILCTALDWKGMAADVAVMEAAMPPMITAGAMASMLGLAPRLSNAIVGYGIFLSLLTTYGVWLLTAS